MLLGRIGGLNLCEKQKSFARLAPLPIIRRLSGSLMLAGMNVARFNFSHGTHEEHLNRLKILKELREDLGLPHCGAFGYQGARKFGLVPLRTVRSPYPLATSLP